MIILSLPDNCVDPINNEEAAYLMPANLPYEEYWLPLHDNFLSDLEYLSGDALIWWSMKRPSFGVY